jgi:radical SAM-linked protein
VSEGADHRLRFRYSVHGKVRFCSQRDVARMWERALRRSPLEVAWSQGFSPRPLLSFGLALPTGAESLGEYLDVRLEQPAGGARGELSAMPGVLTPLLPGGIEVEACAPLEDGALSLQQAVASCVWELEVDGLEETEMAAQIEQALGAGHLPVARTRKGRPVHDDLRPAIRELTLLSAGGPATGGTVRLRAELATQPRGVRPGELLSGIGADLALVRALRTHQWIEDGGSRREPLAVRGTGAALHAEKRAS